MPINTANLRVYNESASKGKKHMEQAQSTYVFNSDVTVNDVLLGRGDHSVRHEGNIRFREVIQKHLNVYFLPGNNNSTKSKIAGSVINIILARQGRFLRKATAQDLYGMNIPSGVKPWIPIGTNAVSLVRKVKQAFRDIREQGKKVKKADEKDNKEKKQMSHQPVNALLREQSMPVEALTTNLVTSILVQQRGDALLQREVTALQHLRLLESLERQRLEQEVIQAATDELRRRYQPFLLTGTSTFIPSIGYPDRMLQQANNVYPNVLTTPPSPFFLLRRQGSQNDRNY